MISPGKDPTVVERVCEVVWAIALICLPITTFPLYSSLTGALVAPFSILPFFILLLIWGLPILLRKGAIPKESTPLVVFTLVAILACAAAFFIYIPGFKGKSIPAQEIRALFTLAVGITFYLVTITWVKNIDKLRSSWKFITIGGILSLVWTGCQAFFVLRNAGQYPVWLEQIQSWFVVLSPSFSPIFGRVSGLTYEASWFAHQMVMIYLPIWIAASSHKTSAFKFRFLHFSAENILLVFGLAAFYLSSPRIGLLSFFLMVMYIFMRLNLALYRKIVGTISRQNFFVNSKSLLLNHTSLKMTTSLFIISIYAVLIVGAFFFASQRDWRLSLLVSAPH